jgi:hypothetical protein
LAGGHKCITRGKNASPLVYIFYCCGLAKLRRFRARFGSSANVIKSVLSSKRSVQLTSGAISFLPETLGARPSCSCSIRMRKELRPFNVPDMVILSSHVARSRCCTGNGTVLSDSTNVPNIRDCANDQVVIPTKNVGMNAKVAS